MLTQLLDSKCYSCLVWNTRGHVTSSLIQLCVKGELFLQAVSLIKTNGFYHSFLFIFELRTHVLVM